MKLQLVGNALNIASEVTKEMLETVAAARPTALQLVNEDKVPYFSAMLNIGKEGGANKAGIVFNHAGKDGKLSATILVTDIPNLKRDFLAPVSAFTKLEKQIIAVFTEVSKETEELFKGL